MQFSIFKVLSAFLFLTSLVSLSTLAHPTPYSHLTSQATASPALVEIIHEFPLGTWVENLAVRKNGQILASILTTPEIYLVDPSQQPPTAALVATFPALGCLGIAEVKPDLFYVITGTSLSTPSQTPQAPIPVASKVADFPTANLLNGMTLLSKDFVLLADAGLGAVWRLNVNTGETAQIITDPSMAPLPGGSGINGLHVLNNYLYYTNLNTATFFRIPINADGSGAGPVESVAEGLTGADDFTIDASGHAYIALGSLNEVALVGPVGGGVCGGWRPRTDDLGGEHGGAVWEEEGRYECYLHIVEWGE